MSQLSIIAALQAKDNGLGKNNELLFRISEDLKRFKALTTGHPVIMGRKTFESIGRPLPNRTNIIITRNPDFKAEGCIIVSSLENAISEANKVEQHEIFVIGGAEIYKQALPLADKLHLTLIEGDQQADIFFPAYSEFSRITFKEEHLESEPKYTFIDLEK